MKKQQLVNELTTCGAIKRGTFTLKSGQITDTYIDLRLAHNPDVTNLIRGVLQDKLMALTASDLKTIAICGVPYSGLVYAAMMSASMSIPLVVVRKESKEHGSERQIDGLHALERPEVIVIEDVVTTGQSVFEVVRLLRDGGAYVRDIVTIVDRRSQNVIHSWPHDIKLHSVFTMDDINRMGLLAPRIALCKNPVAKRLMECMLAKRTNLCVAIDVYDVDEVMRLVEKLAPLVCMFKFHMDLYNPEVFPHCLCSIEELGMKHGFVVFNDRKFADIGSVVKEQMNGGQVVSAHPVAGQSCIDGILAADGGVGIFLVANMSCAGSFYHAAYTAHTLALAENNPNVIGFIAQGKVGKRSMPHTLVCTPGVSLRAERDTLGQRYSTPDAAIRAGADIIIVGRSIYEAEDVVAEATKYRDIAWAAFVDRCGPQ